MPPGVMYPDHLRIQAVFQGVSGLPEDRYVNTFHVRNDSMVGTWQDSVETVAEAVREFYFDAAGNPALPLIRFMDNVRFTSVEFRGYDLGQDEPREPHIVPGPPKPWAGVVADISLPHEVAAVLSFASAVIPPKTGTVGKRGRGRMFIGPLCGQALSTVDVNTDPRIDPDLQDTATAAFARYAAYSSHTPVVLSPTYQETDPITKVWMDDAFDTVRKRGGAPASRVSLTL